MAIAPIQGFSTFKVNDTTSNYSVKNVSNEKSQPLTVQIKGGGGKAVSSLLLPGLGQFCDGRNKAGAAFLGGQILLDGMLGMLAVNIGRSVACEVLPGKGKIFLGATALVLAVANRLVSFVDAYKGGLNSK